MMALHTALLGADQVFTTGLVLQELLQGFAGPKAGEKIIERFATLAFLQPDREDHIELPQRRAGGHDRCVADPVVSPAGSGAAERGQGLRERAAACAVRRLAERVASGF